MNQNHRQPASFDVGPDQIAALIARNQQLEAAIQGRSMSKFGEIVDALGYTVQAAQRGDPGAREGLRAFLNGIKAGEAAINGIVLADGSPPQT